LASASLAMDGSFGGIAMDIPYTTIESFQLPPQRSQASDGWDLSCRIFPRTAHPSGIHGRWSKTRGMDVGWEERLQAQTQLLGRRWRLPAWSFMPIIEKRSSDVHTSAEAKHGRLLFVFSARILTQWLVESATLASFERHHLIQPTLGI